MARAASVVLSKEEKKNLILGLRNSIKEAKTKIKELGALEKSTAKEKRDQEKLIAQYEKQITQIK